jgi:NADPH:quinone reductase
VRAIQITENGGPEVLNVVDLPAPDPKQGEVVVEVGAAGVNYIDTYHRGGVYKVDLPLVLGLEGAGRVLAVGDRVEDVAVGDRVAWTNTSGSYAEQVVVPAAETVPVPDGVDDASAVGALLQGMTAWILVHQTYPVQAGDDVLVHAAAGGVGLLLTQLASGLGARVIATVSTDEKEQLARAAGAADVLRYSDDLAEQVRDLTDGVGVAVAYDGVGKTTFDASMDSLRRRGMLVLFGAASGPVPPVDPQRLNAGGSLYLTRPTLFHHIATREELLSTAGSVYAEVAAGRLDVRIGHRYGLHEARTAHEDLQARRTTGKLVLIP